jgi:hypothetical protein
METLSHRNPATDKTSCERCCEQARIKGILVPTLHYKRIWSTGGMIIVI